MQGGSSDRVSKGHRGMKRDARFRGDESGAEIVEWVVVTMILIVAFFALFQAIGDELTALLAAVRQWLTDTLAR